MCARAVTGCLAQVRNGRVVSAASFSAPCPALQPSRCSVVVESCRTQLQNMSAAVNAVKRVLQAAPKGVRSFQTSAARMGGGHADEPVRPTSPSNCTCSLAVSLASLLQGLVLTRV